MSKVPSVTFEPTVDPFLAREIADNEDEGLDKKYRKLAKEYFGKVDEDKLVAQLRQRIHEEGLKVPTRRAFVLKILRAAAYDVDDSLKLLKSYVGHLKGCPQYFEKAFPHKMGFVDDLKVMSIMPQRDQYGRRVAVYRAKMWNPDKVSLAEAYCLSYMFAEMMALEPKTQIAGVSGVADAQGFSLKMLRAVTVDDCKNAASFVQECFPLWFRAVHVVNAPYVFTMAYNLIKPFLNESLKSRIMFHKSLEDLHEYVPKEILPEDFGGLTGEFNSDECFQALNQMEHTFEEIQTYDFIGGEARKHETNGEAKEHKSKSKEKKKHKSKSKSKESASSSHHHEAI